MLPKQLLKMSYGKNALRYGPPIMHSLLSQMLTSRTQLTPIQIFPRITCFPNKLSQSTGEKTENGTMASFAMWRTQWLITLSRLTQRPRALMTGRNAMITALRTESTPRQHAAEWYSRIGKMKTMNGWSQSFTAVCTLLTSSKCHQKTSMEASISTLLWNSEMVFSIRSRTPRYLFRIQSTIGLKKVPQTWALSWQPALS